MYKNILDLFHKTVEEKADKVAVIHNNDNITFGDLDKKVDTWQNACCSFKRMRGQSLWQYFYRKALM